MKRRLLALFLTLIMILSIFTACTKVDTPTDSGTNTENKTEDNTDDKDDDNEVQNELSILKLYKEKGNDGEYKYTETYSGYIAYMEYEVLHLMPEDAEKYPLLNETLNNLADGVIANVKTIFENAREAALNDFDPDNTNYSMVYNIKEDYNVRRADETVLSIAQQYESFTGGAHGYYATYPDNYDTKTGKLIDFKDVVTDIDKAYERIGEAIKEKYADSIDMFLDDLSFTEYKNNEYPQLFTIDYDGITVIYNPYDIAAYAVGQVTVKLSYEENKDILDEKYFTDVPASYAIQLSPYEEYTMDIDGDGELDTVRISTFFPTIYDNVDTITFVINGQPTDVKDEELYAFQISTFLIKAPSGKVYAYLECIGMNDYATLNIFEIKKDGIGKRAEVDLGISDPSYVYDVSDGYKWIQGIILNPNDMRLEHRTDVFGTSHISKKYKVGEDGLPVTDDEVYLFDSRLDYTAKKEMKLKVVDEEGNETDDYDLKAGDHVYAYRTDGETFVDAKLADGRIVRFNLTTKEWPYLIDGIDIEEIFEDVIFAG